MFRRDFLKTGFSLACLFLRTKDNSAVEKSERTAARHIGKHPRDDGYILKLENPNKPNSYAIKGFTNSLEEADLWISHGILPQEALAPAASR
jgi:hypothetical protein